MKKMRLDKYLADMGVGSRAEVKQYMKKGQVKVNGEVVKSPDVKVSGEDDVTYLDRPVAYVTLEYYMLNKPAGVLSAARDKKCETVVDLIEDAKRKDLFPVGRLDKDTEGLLIISNDGELTHRLLSPKKHVAKVYYAKIDSPVTEEDVRMFKEGIQIHDDLLAMPAELTILNSNEDGAEIELVIYEGKFHQVKKMFEAVGKEVTYLKRLSMGNLKLDETLELGEYRELTREEVEGLYQCNE